jgi:Tfp pilus assembly protein PilN
MLGMIEINLLPQEYRVQERTPLVLFLTIVVGICTVGAIGVVQINLNKELAQKQLQRADLEREKAETDKKKEEVQKLEKEIDVAKKRQETIIEISQSKIIWSQKLIQFGKIMAEYPDFWIDRLNLARSGDRGGKLTLNFYALGNDLRKAAAFRERVISDTNFWYHFDKFDAPTIRVQQQSTSQALIKSGYTGPTMYFDVSFPVR